MKPLPSPQEARVKRIAEIIFQIDQCEAELRKPFIRDTVYKRKLGRLRKNLQVLQQPTLF